MDKKIKTMTTKVGNKKERKAKNEDGKMVIQLSSVQNGRDKQKIDVRGKNARKTTFNIGWI